MPKQLKVDHPTRVKLVETLIEFSRFKPINLVQANEVLRASKVSKGSLYHHFENYQDLLETAHLYRFAKSIERLDQKCIKYFTNKSEVYDLDNYLNRFLDFMSDRKVDQERISIIQCIAMTENNKKFEKKAKLYFQVLDYFIERNLDKGLAYFSKLDKSSQACLISFVRVIFLGQSDKKFTNMILANLFWREMIDNKIIN